MSEMTSSPSPSPTTATRREHLPDRAEDYPGVGFGQVVLREAGQVTTIHDEKPRGGRMPRNARRAQLLESALEVFVAQGYHAAAMDDIAERAGVSKPVLYQHFPGKLELYLALLDQSCDTIIEACRQALASTDDNKQRVEAAMHVFYDYVANAPAEFDMAGQVWIQTQAVLTAIVWSAVVAFIAFKIVDIVIGLRVTEEAEREGLDTTSHGEAAYRM